MSTPDYTNKLLAYALGTVSELERASDSLLRAGNATPDKTLSKDIAAVRRRLVPLQKRAAELVDYHEQQTLGI